MVSCRVGAALWWRAATAHTCGRRLLTWSLMNSLSVIVTPSILSDVTPPSCLPDIQRVTALKILGVTIADKLIIRLLILAQWGRWKRGTGKRGNSKNAGVENASQKHIFEIFAFHTFQTPAFSSPAFSTPAVWCRVFQSRVFQSRVFSRPMLATYSANKIIILKRYMLMKKEKKK